MKELHELKIIMQKAIKEENQRDSILKRREENLDSINAAIEDGKDSLAGDVKNSTSFFRDTQNKILKNKFPELKKNK